MKKQFYRFRSINNLLSEKYNELENQSIYFASTNQLNDPMEGFKDLVFNGDSITYKNLFKHYLMCLKRISSLYIIAGEEYHKITADNIPIYDSFDDFPTPMYKELFEKISKEFFEIFEDFIDTIATRTTPIKRDELSFYFDTIHFITLEIIYKNYQENKLLPQREKVNNIDLEVVNKIKESINIMEKLLKEENGVEKFEALIFIQKQMHDELALINNAQNKFVINFPNKNFVLIDFVNIYLESLERLMYPNWYTACFMTESHNSSVWGHYGDSHKGVCLIFETNERESITFSNGKIGEDLNGIVRGNIEHKFYKVNYQEGYPEIEFFRSIGRLPKGKLYSTWYKGHSSDSKIFDDFTQDEDKWRKNYWDTFYKNILIKTKDWEYEKEYRLILSGLLDDEIKKENRILYYDFKHLKGLIFGIKTSLEDKLKIIDIIANKCKINNRNDFEFYQAYYCHKNKNIQHKKLNLIKFKN
ncbi:DUF2971 domain-containing protein [Aliarcobacter butzleri]|uniref:DUF2971 domain-containing protein n=1 Tax=Aliarcobacter butzleri TaxID=28197 RepID=UPI00125FACD2|nr:DUF2971 domain-containing protein [Aliarcobacter butzleri]